MPGFLNNHGKGRTRSIQLDHSFSMSTQAVDHKPWGPSHRPRLSVGATSVGNQENQVPVSRYYRSMLVVDAPLLGPHKPLSFDEFSVEMMPGISLFGLLRPKPRQIYATFETTR